ncbi:hypothetical protein SAMN05880582_101415 [Rhizobium sp. RU20A]|uniref:hypothetical protein n=1 Tax=Rhizobium sp. RU20A TaxID=1907412 RepID=UPI0009569FE3|nr:hypothetical protein [Rhizobium sp. RU20A]SIQ02175.1 hypothetical protein SAMN05880582_101415 [Rhizobium sp. RU20A]
MDLQSTLWIGLMAAVIISALFFRDRMLARAARDATEADTGLAILDFGRAYPEEAIRSIHMTEDEGAYFLRLHDGKAGFMQAHGAHYLCHLLGPGSVQMSAGPDNRSIRAHFPDFAYLDGVYRFRSEAEAAEVSLLLLETVVPRDVAPFSDDDNNGGERPVH